MNHPSPSGLYSVWMPMGMASQWERIWDPKCEGLGRKVFSGMWRGILLRPRI